LSLTTEVAAAPPFFIEQTDRLTKVVPAEDQNRIENSSALLSGFVQINKTSFFKR
jgi:hypothetical protein